MSKKPAKTIQQTPAEAVIDIFGGASNLARALGCHRSTICRWTLSAKKKGTGGQIPGSAKDDILKLAKKLGKDEVTYDVLYHGRTLTLDERATA